MKTLTQLKKDLQKAKSLTMLYNGYLSFNKSNHLIGIERKIEKIQSEKIGLATIDHNGGKCISWFYLPKASMLEYDGDTFSIYYLDDGEKKIGLTYQINY